MSVAPHSLTGGGDRRLQRAWLQSRQVTDASEREPGSPPPSKCWLILHVLPLFHSVTLETEFSANTTGDTRALLAFLLIKEKRKSPLLGLAP